MNLKMIILMTNWGGLQGRGLLQSWVDSYAETDISHAFEYDAEGQLTDGSMPEINGNFFAFSYDAAGNRIGNQIEKSKIWFGGGSHNPAPTVINHAEYNDLNQVTNRSGNGLLSVYFKGTINQPAVVTVSADTNSITGTTWIPNIVQPAEVVSNPASTTGGQIFAASIGLFPGLYGLPVGSSTSSPYIPPVSVIA